MSKDNVSLVKHQMWVNPLMMVILGTFRFVISPFLGWSDLVNNMIFAVWVVALVLVNYLLYLNWKRNRNHCQFFQIA